MKQLIESVMNEFEIPCEKIFMFLRDAAEVMIKIFEEAGYKSIDCFAHKLNLVCQINSYYFNTFKFSQFGMD